VFCSLQSASSFTFSPKPGTQVANNVKIALPAQGSSDNTGEGVAMAIRSGLFGKADDKVDEKARNLGVGSYNVNPTAARPMPAGEPPASPRAPAPGMPSTQAEGAKMDESQGSKLIVGPNIKLKGVEITDCDTLVVEGHVEATMDSRAIQIAQSGTFSGNAGIDVAEIRGSFTGELTVRKKLVIHATGKVSGTVRYGKLVIEEGGELSGDVKTLSPQQPGVAPAPKPLPAQPALHH
jgi:cytoskeletal protein CcmA (bactofilin family)